MRWGDQIHGRILTTTCNRCTSGSLICYGQNRIEDKSATIVATSVKNPITFLPRTIRYRLPSSDAQANAAVIMDRIANEPKPGGSPSVISVLTKPPTNAPKMATRQTSPFVTENSTTNKLPYRAICQLHVRPTQKNKARNVNPNRAHRRLNLNCTTGADTMVI